MASNSRSAEPFQYMMEVDNGLVHGVEWSPDKDTYTQEDLKSEDKTPETILKACENSEYDFEYDNFSSEAISATKVGIDAVNGIIDVYKGDDLVDRYSLVGVLEDEEGDQELVFSGFDHDETHVVAKNSTDVEWSPNLAAAYEAVYRSIDFERELEEETVSFYGDEEDEDEDNVTSLDEISARKTVKKIDDFMSGLNDPAAGLRGFEDNGKISVHGGAHYGSERGYKAAMGVKSDLNRLNSAGLMDYVIEPLNNNGDEKEVDLRIAGEFLDGKGSLRDDVNGLSDFDIESHDGREELTEERM